MKNPYKDMANEELSLIYKDYVDSKCKWIRCESFVPYAKEIKENIGGDFTLAEAIRLAKLDFFEEVCNRFLYKETNMRNTIPRTEKGQFKDLPEGLEKFAKDTAHSLCTKYPDIDFADLEFLFTRQFAFAMSMELVKEAMASPDE